ncbi:MAG TPA: hypothetical protein VFF64_20335 [Candidatus Eremiobacteraceae bacterium]|nr:hypothetical protein [Candidatus Eremiobacteraceae bacterium]
MLFLLLGLFHLVLEGCEEPEYGRGGGNSAFEHLGFPEGNNILDRILQTETVGGALGTEQLYFRGAEVGA